MSQSQTIKSIKKWHVSITCNQVLQVKVGGRKYGGKVCLMHQFGKSLAKSPKKDQPDPDWLPSLECGFQIR